MSASSVPALRRKLRLWHLVLFQPFRHRRGSLAGCGGACRAWVAHTVAIGCGGFFLPSALVVSSLSARFPEEGGFYIWTKHAFGPGMVSLRMALLRQQHPVLSNAAAIRSRNGQATCSDRAAFDTLRIRCTRFLSPLPCCGWHFW